MQRAGWFAPRGEYTAKKGACISLPVLLKGA